MAKDTSERAETRRDNRVKMNALTKMGQFRLARWTNRRQLEWKTSASVWAFLVALASAIALKKVTVPLFALVIFLAALVAAHFWWIYQNWERNREDTGAAFDSFTQACMLLSIPMPERKRQTPRWIIQDAVPTFEGIITLLLSVALLWLTWALTP